MIEGGSKDQTRADLKEGISIYTGELATGSEIYSLQLYALLKFCFYLFMG